jgi:peptidoglycan/xylan/chitin deacetylase (PgdA/CDA1 family)
VSDPAGPAGREGPEPPDEGQAERRLAELRRRRELRRRAERRRRAGVRRRRGLLGVGVLAACAGAFLGGRANNPGPPGPVLVHSRKPIPILMYHAISSPPAGTALPELFVKPFTFRAQIKQLAARGYTAITLKQAYDAWESDGLVPEKPIVLSFDDGYRGDYTDAMPILKERNWPGVLNLEVGNLEDGELTDEMVEEMIDAGWEVDSHTISHLDLTGIKGKDLRREVAGSRELLSDRFGVPVDFFCYPAGRFDGSTVAEVEAAGYLGATTTEPGLAARDQLFRLRRIRINGEDGVRGMTQKLRAAQGG